MQTKSLTPQDVLAGYDAVCALYPYVPPLSHWRSWEYAAYQYFELDGRVLDLGCGDGRYFHLIWPKSKEVVGVDMNPDVATLGQNSGTYRAVHVVPAHQIPEPDASFDHVFANCSLEHMDSIDAVLTEINRCLKPGGSLLCSVVTDRFIEWAPLPDLVAMAGFKEASIALQKDFFNYHHLVNPLSVEQWVNHFRRCGLVTEVHIPILPKFNSSIFLLMDSLWHVNLVEGGEMGGVFHPFLMSNPKFPEGFRKVFSGLMEMETDWLDCSGAVFLVRKPG